jgi:hypothetical protein
MIPFHYCDSQALPRRSLLIAPGFLRDARRAQRDSVCESLFSPSIDLPRLPKAATGIINHVAFPAAIERAARRQLA